MSGTQFTTLERDFELDAIAPRGRIGLICLATDFNIEEEFPRMLPEGVGLYVNRVRNVNPLTVENLLTLKQEIARAADGLLPGLGVDVMAFACTSGTAAIGNAQVTELIHSVCPGVTVTNPLTAAHAAMDALGAARISVLTPYLSSLNRALLPAIAKPGLEILNITGLDMEDDIDIAGVPLETIVKAAKQACQDEADLLFISCTALRSARVVAELEAALGKPVLTSNQVLAWHSLRLLGHKTAIEGYGRLFAKV